MEKFACHVNMVKADDGHCALHVAAANDHCDILCHLAAMVSFSVLTLSYIAVSFNIFMFDLFADFNVTGQL